MKKKLLALVTTSLLISSAANASVKVGLGFDQGFGVTAQFNNINAFVGNDGIAGDYIFKRGSFNEDTPFNWYVAGGAFLGWDHGVGVRLPLGLNMAFDSKWDGYLQFQPELDFDHGKNSDTNFSADFSIGVRYRF
ncbi:hypothetical protein [Colwellia sp. RSH04]|uniref:hypothetical protein n=1 Tax=Colwellia sp. RSH04 TaxID=2305464 RepID=UPI000E5701AD|nr:hypothetical protein [Colwellia sp. RSH04]RHW75870.1 hypothetical protein D1094_12205 [Colwellia sp. RSH04]